VDPADAVDRRERPLGPDEEHAELGAHLVGDRPHAQPVGLEGEDRPPDLDGERGPAGGSTKGPGQLHLVRLVQLVAPHG
jgi:hypothetical protein